MQVLLLGPVAVVDHDDVRRVTSAKQASLLALLGSRAGEAVSRDRLIESLWGSHPPTTARNTLQVHVSALRKLLGADAIRHDLDSYLLDPERVTVDTVRFEQLTREGTDLHELGRHDDAVRALRAALALWRGEPNHFVDSPWAAGESRRLEELRLLAATTCLAADLALGRHLLVLDELAALCLAHPYHEELAATRMLALYRSGRQADALAAYAQVRRDLAEDLGMDPGPERDDMAVAARCLGAYEAVLHWAMMPPPDSDTRLRHTWLHDVDPVPPEASVEETLRALVAYFAESDQDEPADASGVTSAPSTRGTPPRGPRR